MLATAEMGAGKATSAIADIHFAAFASALFVHS